MISTTTIYSTTGFAHKSQCNTVKENIEKV